jgi:hypothetical protein
MAEILVPALGSTIGAILYQIFIKKYRSAARRTDS